MIRRPCPTIIAVAVALGIGPPDEHPWCYLLERLAAAPREARTP